MAIGVQKNRTNLAVTEEVTEGTYVAPTVGTEFVQALTDGLSFSPVKNTVERSVLTSGLTDVTPRTSTKEANAEIGVEWKASGTEGAVPDYDLLLKGLLGGSRQVASQFTTDTGHSSSVLNVTAHPFTVGDIVVILEAGSHHVCAISAQTAGTLTITPAASFTPSDNVVISKTTTYFSADTGHPTLSTSFYWGDEIREAGTGMRVNSMSMSSFTTGALAQLSFSLSGLGFTRVDGSAPVTPSLPTGLPPVILGACVSQNDTNLDVNEFAFTVEQPVTYLTSTCSEDGRIAGRPAGKRNITGTMNPYLDDTATTQFDFFDDDTEYSLFAFAAVPSSTAGEYELGSVVGVYMPNVLTQETPVSDLDEIHVNSVSFKATGGPSGSNIGDIFMGVI